MKTVKLADYDYQLPPERIAQTPSDQRTDSRLLLVHRRTGEIEHLRFRDLPSVLAPSDLLVLNNTRVFPARLFSVGEGRSLEVLLLKEVREDCWEALVRPGKKAPMGRHLVFSPDNLEAEVIDVSGSPVRTLRFSYEGDFWTQVDRLGRMPLPPYIRREPAEPTSTADVNRYQTVFALHRGSVAAPTAGLHFSTDLLQATQHCFVTLHVGYGTFKPIQSKTVEEHRMEPEFYSVDNGTAQTISNQLDNAGRVISVGSTSTRTLEHIAQKHGRIISDQGWTDLFIYPGFEFRVAGGLLTNFHLPESTLILLTAAFGGRELILECYRKAIEKGYRFYSYGDAMLIL